MTDILEEREKKRRKLLGVLQNIVRIMMDEEALGIGRIKVVSEDINYHDYHLKIPINSADFFAWDEILHDGS